MSRPDEEHSVSFAEIESAMRQKKGTNFLLCGSFLILRSNWRIFFTYTEERIKYNFVYLILACVKICI